ncbi:hypothetical protein FXO38_22932 [Capsicum annuum]|nr:hypothetical protein FXO38_22932 [Capsicum annuum]
MANNPLPLLMDYSDEEDYIDIEVLSSCSYFSSCPNSSPLNREFEFQMASITNNKESTIAPADELFYRGKLLPLHQKSQRIAPFEEDLEEGEEESFCINFLIAPISSASQSCRVSFEFNPNDLFFERSRTELTISSHNKSPNKLWSKLINQSLINQKFKASKAFLKSLFSKSSCCSEELKVSKKTTPFRNTAKNIEGLSSRSFSAAETKWHPPIKGLSSSSTNSSSSTGGSFSSSSCSFNSNNGFYELNFLKRSNSFTSGFEGSIEAAVAHCKKSLECGWA